jgi:hypothetical protein
MLSGVTRRSLTTVASAARMTRKDWKPPNWLTPRNVGTAVGILGAGYTLKNSMLMTDAGYIYVVQNNISGTLDVYTEPGIHRRMPFFSTVTAYRKVLTVTQDSRVRFADTYLGTVPASFRFKLPLTPNSAIKLHTEFRSEKNLVDVLLKRNARNVTVITATQYTGEEFFQGGLNSYKTQLQDQLNDGIYLTERKQVEVDQVELAPIGSDQDDSTKLRLTTQLVWKTVPVTDEHGNLKRTENPLSQYEIDVTQVLIGDPQPEEQLENLLFDKKKLVADRIKAVQEQETSKAQAKTEQLKKEIARTKAVQDAQREKELAVISQQKELEVAKQIAERQLVEQKKLQDLAIIDKEKELNIARANLGIFKANSEAAIHEARAIAAKGQAEAKVTAAKYAALGKNKDIYLAEVNRDIAKTIYENLDKFKIEMPHNYIGGGGGSDSGKLTSNLDVITGLSALKMMESASK